MVVRGEVQGVSESSLQGRVEKFDSALHAADKYFSDWQQENPNAEVISVQIIERGSESVRYEFFYRCPPE